jgi:glycosyltransferase involved in cell wall biosynthesis
MKKKRILYLGDYVARTGFATVNKNIVRELKKHYGEALQLDIVAINYFGEPYYEDDNTYVISARLNDVKDDPFGRYFFLKMLKESNEYDGIFICQDLGVIVPIIELIDSIKAEKREKNQKGFKSIFYFPVDCSLIYELTKGLQFFDVLVTYTEYGRGEVLKQRQELKGKIKVLPHGNNSKDFYPLPEDEIAKFRKEYFGENADKFIISNINRNQPRKDIGCTIIGFKEYLEINPNSFLYLGMNSQDPLGNDLRIVINQLGLKEDIHVKFLPKEYEKTGGVSIEILNLIYNASDIFVTTTLGGGWELTVTEAMACRLPIIAPKNTSLIEIGNGRVTYLEDYELRVGTDNIIRQSSFSSELAEKIDFINKKILSNDKDLISMLDNAQLFVGSLEWSIVCKRWIEYFKIF